MVAVLELVECLCFFVKSKKKESLFTPITPPVEIFSFDLSCRKAPISFKDQSVVSVDAINEGNNMFLLFFFFITLFKLV